MRTPHALPDVRQLASRLMRSLPDAVRAVVFAAVLMALLAVTGVAGWPAVWQIPFTLIGAGLIGIASAWQLRATPASDDTETRPSTHALGLVTSALQRGR